MRLVFFSGGTDVPKRTAVHIEDSEQRMRGFVFHQYFSCRLCDAATTAPSLQLLLSPPPATIPAKIVLYQQPRNLFDIQRFLLF